MLPTRQGAFRLFRVAGVDVFLHWWWFLAAAYEFTQRSQTYHHPLWNVLEYVALFGIVLLHEFGHALACRQVGGIANQIILWPLGGVAYVNPPPRPGAVLWSIAAGPLVNVVLVPVLLVVGLASRASGFAEAAPDAHALLRTMAIINLMLLIFNMLPVYPLDGGQILRALLWFWLGRARSLMVASVIGVLGAIGVVGLAFMAQSIWLGIVAVFILMRCWNGVVEARALTQLATVPRHGGFTCPTCKAAPPVGAFWMCNQCRTPFDTFEAQAVCPKCAAQFPVTRCIECGRLHPLSEWTIAAPAIGS